MTHSLTPGRWRGLQNTSNNDHLFTILAFDQRGTLIDMLPNGATYETAVEIKQEFVSTLAPLVSAVLLDPIYGLPAAMHMGGSTGLLLALEKSGYSGVPTARKIDFIEGWTVEKIKKAGASAVKLLAYYHPHTDMAGVIEAVIADVCRQCHEHDLPLFVEPVSYSPDSSISKDSAEFAKTRPEIVRETARRINALQPDVLKLEFPIDVKYDRDAASWKAACHAVSDVVDVPWVLLSAGVDFDVFEEQVKVACAAGASGFLAGRAIWKEGVGLPPADRKRFAQETASDRLRRLGEITEELARPWTDFYKPIENRQDWYASYL
jgi:tagatose 1,6-diphosphate aldolase